MSVGPVHREHDPRATREALVVTAVATACIFGVTWIGVPRSVPAPLFYPFWWGLCVVGLLFVPLLAARFVLRRPLRDLGLRLDDARRWVPLVIGLYVVTLPVFVWMARIPAVHVRYPEVRAVLAMPWLWLPVTLAWGACHFASEFAFRGFLLFGLARRIGAAAIFVQAIPFVLVHIGKPVPELALAGFTGVALGALAWRTRTVVAPWLLHWAIATTTNLFCAYLP